jgi:transcriptional regulator with XRE-family HTH domain
MIGVDPRSLLWWERGERESSDRSWPAPIAYLGQEPWPAPQSLGERLLAERRRRGLFIFEAAKIAGVDETTFWWWESGRRKPRYPRTKALAAQFLGDL